MKKKKRENYIKKISFVLAILGILLLLFLSINLPPKKINIQEINSNLLNKYMQANGQISDIRTYNLTSKNTLQILEIHNPQNKTEKIEVVLNNPKFNLEKDQNIIVSGRITSYKNSLQIQADEITLLP